MEEQVTEVKREVIITNNNQLFDLIQATIMTSSSAFLKMIASRYELGHHFKYLVCNQLHRLSCLRSLTLITLVVPRGTS